MSITLGIYDVFSYVIPGLLYLFAFNEGLKVFNAPSADIARMNNITYLFLIGLLAYLVGHLFDHISHHIWYRRFYPGKSAERAYSSFLNHADLESDFHPRQWPMLLSVIRHNNMEVCNTIDKNKATSIMLRNVSFALFLLTIIFLVSAFSSGFSAGFLITAIGMLIGSIVSLRRSDNFNQWFYLLIYQQSAVYGSNLQEVVNGSKLSNSKREQPENKKAEELTSTD